MPTFANSDDATHFLAAIVSSTELPIMGIDLDGRIVAWNRGAERLFWHAAGDALGRSIALIMPSDRPGELPNLLDRLRRDEPIEQFRTIRVRADGEHLQVSLTWTPILEVTGRLVGAAILIQDLSDQVRAEADLRRMALGASLPHGEKFFGALVTYLCKVLDVTFALVQERDPHDESQVVALAVAHDGNLLPPQRFPVAGSMCEAVLGGTSVSVGRDLAARFPGCTQYAAFGIQAYVGVPLRDEAGRTFGVLSIAHNAPLKAQAFIHELLEVAARRAEAELQRRRDRAALAESEARYRRLVDMFPDAVVVQEHGVIRFANPSAGAMLAGAPADALIGRKLLDFVVEPDLATAAGTLSQPSQDDRPSLVEHQLQCEDGRLLDVEVATAGIGFQGRPAELVVMHDVSARREVARMKDEFIAMVSHELRHPINTIILALDAVGSGMLGAVPPPITRMLDVAQSSTDRLARLVADILDLQLLETDRVKIAPRACLTRKVLQDAADAVAPMALRHHVELTLEPVPAELGVWADASRIHQVLVNLLVNAVRHSPPGARVVLAASTDGDEVRLRVEDQGPGVPVELREQVFERFFQGPPAPNAESKGTGLGLAICRLVVQKHRGRAYVEDAAIGGAAFVIALPMSPPQGG